MNQEELKQRLIEILTDSKILCNDCGDYGNTYCIEAIADHLIANGVTIRECGEWTFACVHNGKKFYKCSNCWHAFPSVDKESCEETCPHCGADMRGGSEPPETEKGDEGK